MKNLLATLALFLALPSHATTTCTGVVKQVALDIGGNNRLYVVLDSGAGISMPQQGDAYKIVDAMASMSKSIGEQINFVYAADGLNCSTIGIRSDVVRVKTA